MESSDCNAALSKFALNIETVPGFCLIKVQGRVGLS